MQAVYSILQFRRSLLKDEVFNIGIAFGFIKEPNNEVLFKSTDYQKLKDVYPQMNEDILTIYIKHIERMIKTSEFKLAEKIPLDKGFRLYLRKNILLEDSTVLQFTHPTIITNMENSQVIAERYSKQLLSFKN